MRSLAQKTMHLVDKLISLVIMMTIFIVVFFALFELYKLFQDFSDLTAEQVLHTIALTVVFVKAYRMLRFYMKCHHIGVKYIVEISIIAPAVELIFAPENRTFEVNLLFAVFSVAMLVVYLMFYKRLSAIDEKWQESKAG